MTAEAGERERLKAALTHLQEAERPQFGRALKGFLRVWAPRSAWLLSLPGLFPDLLDVGCRLANRRLHDGLTYFRALKDPGFGMAPERVQMGLHWMKRLLPVDPMLALALLRGWPLLAERLDPLELERYIQEGLGCYDINPALAQQFLTARLPNQEAVLGNIRRECRLTDVTAALEILLFALTERQIVVAPVEALHSTRFTQRLPQMVCLSSHIYLPEKQRHFASKAQNSRWYRLQTFVAAGMLLAGSFPCLHGHPDYPSAAALTGADPLHQNLFQLLEYLRVLQAMQQRWSGMLPLLHFALQHEHQHQPPESATPEALFFDALAVKPASSKAVHELHQLTEQTHNVFETAALIPHIDPSHFLRDYPHLGQLRLRPFTFLPDFFLYTISATPPSENDIEALRRSSPSRHTLESEQTLAMPSPQHSFEPLNATRVDSHSATYYRYDEWNQTQNTYLPGYCYVYERTAQITSRPAIPAEVIREGQRIRRMFELLRPANVRRETGLPEGDELNEMRLIDYQIARRQEPSPPVRFFERLLLRKRDLAVLLLLDLSGSTRERINGQRIIDIEMQAALILGQGLAALGDRFAICGFSSHGREHCDFIVLKNFADTWDANTMARVMSARPLNTTRMGAALRHGGYRLHQIPAHQKLLMLITDGKPLDEQYDPRSRYAQHDVRMACLENTRHSIRSFCLSTQENSRKDLELMFPDRRFVILPTIRQLSRVLPRCYLRLTR